MTAAVIRASVAFWAPATYICVGDDQKPETLRFRVRFNRLKKSERVALDRRINVRGLTAAVREELQARADDASLPGAEREELRLLLGATPITDAEFLDILLTDWELKSVRGEFVPYTKAMRQVLEEELDGLEASIVKAYFDAKRVALDPEAIAKNSEAPSATGS